MKSMVLKMLENNMFKALFDIIPFGIYVVDVENCEIVYMNRFMIEKRGDFIGRKCHESIYGEEKPCYFCKIPLLLSPDRKPNENTIVFENYNAVDDSWYQLQEKCLTWPDGRLVKYSIAVGINELKATQNRLAEAHAVLALKNKELEKLSTTDRLTKLNNRFKLEEILNQELKSTCQNGKEMAVLLLDIDYFKKVNDTYGHQTGDSVLAEFARVLLDSIRKNYYASRWGGEEFLILCPETGIKSAMSFAEDLRRIIEEYTFTTENRITCSIGLTVYKNGDDENAIIVRADKALYKAKQNGRNRVEIE
ncbi:MAG: diguanylate cyclase [Bacillota bacterium]